MAGGTELQILEYHGTGAVLAPVLVARKLPQNLKTFSNVGELISELREDFYMIFFRVNFHLCSFGEKIRDDLGESASSRYFARRKKVTIFQSSRNYSKITLKLL